jgi:hypothetical protein
MTALLILALLAASGCGSSHSRSVAAKSAAPTAPPGLGSPRASFDAAHVGNSHEALAQETLYTFVSSNAAGRVVSYQVSYPSATSDMQRIDLLGGTALPSGAVAVQETPICKLWRSPRLRQLIGFEYARATTVPGTASAQIRATKIPSC